GTVDTQFLDREAASLSEAAEAPQFVREAAFAAAAETAIRPSTRADVGARSGPAIEWDPWSA
ncbi:MAG TPA: hypothetical protein VEU08_06915, partial [Vicinamibacterales bacterium]|nr:hypothetical protein [Vicinamibacterales bacterium]